MLAPDFYGRKPLVWWVGVVEGRKDPLFMGQLRVRIFGLHPKEKTILPTENLPWAIVQHPTTGAKTMSTPREGDWVMGYFQDGEAGQSPVITGVYSGVDTIQANVAGKPYVPPPNNWGFFDPRTKAEVEKGPRPPDHIEDRKVGEPGIYRRLSYGNIKATGIESTNSKLDSVCDITTYVKGSICSAKSFFGQIAIAVRNAMKGLLIALGWDPTGLVSLITSELKRILDIIKTIRKFIKEITDFLTCVNQVLNVINQVTNYIANLPTRLAAFVRNCLTKMLNQIFTALTNVLSSVIPGEVGELIGVVGDIVREGTAAYNDTINAYNLGQQTLTNVQTTINNVQSLPDRLETNSVAAVNSLTASLSSEIQTGATQAVTNMTASAFTLTPAAINGQRVVQENPQAGP